MCIFEWDVYDNVSFEYGHKIARKQHLNGLTIYFINKKKEDGVNTNYF